MADPEEKKPGGFTWIELAKIVAMPVVTLIVGYLFNASLNERQTRDNNVRLYADMMGRREESDSALRKDMFKSILDTFLKKEGRAVGQSLEIEVLNLELLAYNFHESLDLGPLFKYVGRELADGSNKDPNLLWRLERVAAEVKERQLAVLADSGKVERGEINPATETWKFGRSTVEPQHSERRSGPTLCMALDSSNGEKHFRQFKIVFLDFKKARRELEMALSVSKPLAELDCKKILDPKTEQDNVESESQFWVGQFAFPMIDNTHLSHSERCAVSITDISDDGAQVAVSYFQASRASLKDKPYYDEVLHDLLRNPVPTGAKEH